MTALMAKMQTTRDSTTRRHLRDLTLRARNALPAVARLQAVYTSSQTHRVKRQHDEDGNLMICHYRSRGSVDVLWLTVGLLLAASLQAALQLSFTGCTASAQYAVRTGCTRHRHLRASWCLHTSDVQPASRCNTSVLPGQSQLVEAASDAGTLGVHERPQASNRSIYK